MEKRIIELTKINYGSQCLLCCEREATIKVEINRAKYNHFVLLKRQCIYWQMLITPPIYPRYMVYHPCPQIPS